jgi:type III secretion protein R
VVAPAFVVSELGEGFRIGFLLYLAFIVVDLVVANVLVAIGLSQASPTNIAIPLKLLLFVVLDGWSALLHGLVQTYR